MSTDITLECKECGQEFADAAPQQFLGGAREDPESGGRRFLCAERFAGVWRFKWKLQRRGDWTKGLAPTKAMWEHVLDALQRRYRRREGVSDIDVKQVRDIIRELKDAPKLGDE